MPRNISKSEELEKKIVAINAKRDQLRDEADRLTKERDRALADEAVKDKVANMSEAEKDALRAELALEQTVAPAGIDARK